MHVYRRAPFRQRDTRGAGKQENSGAVPRGRGPSWQVSATVPRSMEEPKPQMGAPIPGGQKEGSTVRKGKNQTGPRKKVQNMGREASYEDN